MVLPRGTGATVADTSHPARPDRTVARRIGSPATLVARKTPAAVRLCSRSSRGERLADEFLMALRAGKNGSLPVRYACDPGRSELRFVQDVGDVRRREGQDQDAMRVTLRVQNRDFDVEDRAARNRTSEQVGHLPRLGVDDPLRGFADRRSSAARRHTP